VKSKHLILLFALTVGVISCSKDDEIEDPITYEEQLAKDIETIDTYLAEENINAVEDSTGLRYVITEQGTGDSPNLSDNIVVKYEGRLLSDNSVFDSSDELNFPLNRLIKGWQIGIPKINVGGSITLYIPSGLAYGPSSPSAAVPPNSNLIFDIELLDVQ